jgi:glycosyltransferase involved in cell wall biosynthesis
MPSSSKNKILFILKRREDYNSDVHYTRSLSTGLSNSAGFMDTMLKDMGYDSAVEVVIDNNCIDKVVTAHKPSVVIIEALWVVPEKFKVLTKLHPDVKWIVRLHSELPFIASEGNAMQWIAEYADYKNVYVAANASRMLEEMRYFLKISKNWTNEEGCDQIIYMPNFYPIKESQKFICKKQSDIINISCFGAIRPLKNHLIQAVAALKLADKLGKKLRFHVNVGRIEMKGDPVLNNLKGFFKQLENSGHELVLNVWKTHEDFLQLCGEMDIGLQCSFSETFNIVAADHVKMGVPIVTSDEVPWANKLFTANPVDSSDICIKMMCAWKCAKFNVWINRRNINRYNKKTKKIWAKEIDNL